MKLEVGKAYKTRRGHKAFVFSVSGHPQEAIGVIELKSDGRHSPAMWFIDGSFHWDKKESGNDIVAEWDDTPEPGEGWRLLDVGERLEEGDQFYNSVADWVGACLTWSGGVVQKGSVYRRRIKPDPGEGWKLLDPDEDVEEDDEWFCDEATGWVVTLQAGTRQGVGLFYRRRIAPQYVPYTWEDREELRGRWYRRKDYPEHERLVAHLEISRNEIEINGWGAQKFLQKCEWLDGTPCGKVVE